VSTMWTTLLTTSLLALACGEPDTGDPASASRAAQDDAAASTQAQADPAPAAQGAKASWSGPVSHVPGHPYEVEIVVRAAAGAAIPAAWTTPSGFTVDGEPLGQSSGEMQAAADLVWTLRFDLGPVLDASLPEGDFQLGLEGTDRTQPVRLLRAAPGGLDFMTVEAEALETYGVLLRTTQGDMLVEFWPETAPNHARNFLDLSYTGFYDGVLFHRCIPGFVIQGGDPTTKDPATDPRRYGMGNGPRKLDAEFSDRPHERGVLSAARLGSDVNSATSQFFICHDRVPDLDRQYTGFGELRWGLDVVDAIVTAPKAIDGLGSRGRGTDRPLEPPVLERAIVVRLDS